MVIVLINYKKPLSEVEQYLVAHRAFLDDGYKKNYFIASGPQNPRTGGVILSQLTNKTQLEEILKQDPFQLHGIAAYKFIEFTSVKYHQEFARFVTSEKI